MTIALLGFKVKVMVRGFGGTLILSGGYSFLVTVYDGCRSNE